MVRRLDAKGADMLGRVPPMYGMGMSLVSKRSVSGGCWAVVYCRLVVGEGVKELARLHGVELVDHNHHVTREAVEAHGRYASWIEEDMPTTNRDEERRYDTGRGRNPGHIADCVPRYVRLMHAYVRHSGSHCL